MRELIFVLESIPGSTLKRRKNGQGSWDLELVRRTRGRAQRADLWLKRVSDFDTPVSFSLHKPDPDLALHLVERLTHVCGPLVFLSASKMVPALVRRGSDLGRLARRVF